MHSSPINLSISGDLTTRDGSVIDLANGHTGDILTIGGNYSSDGNTLLMDAFLTGLVENSTSDRIDILGSTSGTRPDYVRIDNLNTNAATGR